MIDKKNLVVIVLFSTLATGLNSSECQNSQSKLTEKSSDSEITPRTRALSESSTLERPKKLTRRASLRPKKVFETGDYEVFFKKPSK